MAFTAETGEGGYQPARARERARAATARGDAAPRPSCATRDAARRPWDGSTRRWRAKCRTSRSSSGAAKRYSRPLSTTKIRDAPTAAGASTSENTSGFAGLRPRRVSGPAGPTGVSGSVAPPPPRLRRAPRRIGDSRTHLDLRRQQALPFSISDPGPRVTRGAVAQCPVALFADDVERGARETARRQPSDHGGEKRAEVAPAQPIARPAAVEVGGKHRGASQARRPRSGAGRRVVASHSIACGFRVTTLRPCSAGRLAAFSGNERRAGA